MKNSERDQTEQKFSARYLSVGFGRAAAALSVGVTIVLGSRDLFGLDGPGWAKVLAFTVAGGFVAAVITVFVQQYQFNQRSNVRARDLRVVQALPKMHNAFHCLRDAGHLMHNDDPDYRKKVRDSLQQFAGAFSLITGTECRASVKVVEGDGESAPELDIESNQKGLKVRTFVRHDSLDLTELDGAEEIYKNTDFLRLVEDSTQRCFFSNDLTTETGYVNSHTAGKTKDEWDYWSTIVWPIRKLISRPNPQVNEYQLVGFLCVDSRERDVFDRDVDFDLGAALADSLYVVLHQRPDDQHMIDVAALEANQNAPASPKVPQAD